MGAASETPTGRLTASRLTAATRLAQRLAERRERFWLLVDLLLVAWLIWLFDAVNNLALVRQGLAIRDGRSVLDLERSLRLDPEHALNIWLARHHALSEIVVFWYENVHIVVTLCVFAWLWWRRADAQGVLRATLLIVNLIALAVFWSFPVAPPRMLTGGYVDLVSSVHGLPAWQIGATALHSNQLCSLPSLHIAWATWCAIVAWRLSSRRGAARDRRRLSVHHDVRGDGDGEPLPCRRGHRRSDHVCRVPAAQPPERLARVRLDGGEKPPRLSSARSRPTPRSRITPAIAVSPRLGAIEVSSGARPSGAAGMCRRPRRRPCAPAQAAPALR